MAAGREILTKVHSIQNTQKITKAMQMVSTSKMRKTQERMRAARPYAEKVRSVIGHLAATEAAIDLPVLREPTEIKRAGFILITTDKGLCGGLNANALKRFFGKVSELISQNVEIEVCTLGSKGLAACERAKLNVVASATQLGDVPKMERLLGPLGVLVKHFTEGKIDAIYVVYEGFINTMKQEPKLEQLLPLQATEMIADAGPYSWDYRYEPDPRSVLDYLLRRYLESVLYQALCDNMASEQAARMVAMRSATDNADSAIKELRLVYNKSRQAAITTELTEIVAGAAAV